jgi:O-antigen/teichoic acid export membrane protein
MKRPLRTQYVFTEHETLNIEDTYDAALAVCVVSGLVIGAFAIILTAYWPQMRPESRIAAATFMGVFLAFLFSMAFSLRQQARKYIEAIKAEHKPA